ncbi:V-type proton ATPase subunit E, partial [Teratosphaeria destructans]
DIINLDTAPLLLDTLNQRHEIGTRHPTLCSCDRYIHPRAINRPHPTALYRPAPLSRLHTAAHHRPTMSQIHAMTDDQVTSELRKMTAFIRQEALEKAREIHLKADEEFSIEKSKLVRSETQRIDTEYQKKFTQAGMSQQITKSTLANKTRLRILGAKQEVLDQLFEQARGRLEKDGTGDKGRYQKALAGLILEGLYALNERKVGLRVRKKDEEVVKKAVEEARKEYREKMGGREVEVVVDEKERLPEGSAGGVVILNGNGKIDINNTFEERLKILETDALPAVRTTLFGENKNRKFKD